MKWKMYVCILILCTMFSLSGMKRERYVPVIECVKKTMSEENESKQKASTQFSIRGGAGVQARFHISVFAPQGVLSQSWVRSALFSCISCQAPSRMDSWNVLHLSDDWIADLRRRDSADRHQLRYFGAGRRLLVPFEP